MFCYNIYVTSFIIYCSELCTYGMFCSCAFLHRSGLVGTSLIYVPSHTYEQSFLLYSASVQSFLVLSIDSHSLFCTCSVSYIYRSAHANNLLFCTCRVIFVLCCSAYTQSFTTFLPILIHLLLQHEKSIIVPNLQLIIYCANTQPFTVLCLPNSLLFCTCAIIYFSALIYCSALAQ